VEKRKSCDPLWEEIRRTFQSDEIKKKLAHVWEHVRNKLGYEEKYFMPATSSTWASGRDQ